MLLNELLTRAPCNTAEHSYGGVHMGPMHVGGDLTIAAWVYDTDVSASWGRVVDLGNGHPGDNILLCHNGASKEIT